jgi:co-chaperonin GroES (HSP10)
MYQQNGKWKSHLDYCFIKPSSKEESIIFNNDRHQALTGTVEITNPELTDLGVKKGNKVCFKPESEYEFKIDDKILYRMKSKNITMTL